MLKIKTNYSVLVHVKSNFTVLFSSNIWCRINGRIYDLHACTCHIVSGQDNRINNVKKLGHDSLNISYYPAKWHQDRIKIRFVRIMAKVGFRDMIKFVIGYLVGYLGGSPRLAIRWLLSYI